MLSTLKMNLSLNLNNYFDVIRLTSHRRVQLTFNVFNK